jgi:hypothetical protein
VDDIEVVEVLESLGDGFEELFSLGFEHSVLGFREEVVVEGVSSSVLED